MHLKLVLIAQIELNLRRFAIATCPQGLHPNAKDWPDVVPLWG